MSTTKRLVFVYNANGGLKNALLDSAHKIFSPSTYACSLCAITYGVFKEDKLWRAYREQSNTSMEFLHKDEFLEAYPKLYSTHKELPLLLTISEEDKTAVLVSATEMNKLKSAEELIKLLQAHNF